MVNVNIQLMWELLMKLPKWLSTSLVEKIGKYLSVFNEQYFSTEPDCVSFSESTKSRLSVAWRKRPKLQRNEKNEVELEVMVENGEERITFYPLDLEGLYVRLELLKEEIELLFKDIHNGPRKRMIGEELVKMFQDNSWMKDEDFIIDLLENYRLMAPLYIGNARSGAIYSYYSVDEDFVVWFNELNCMSGSHCGGTCRCENHSEWKDLKEVSIQTLYESWMARKQQNVIV
jgi:hypothetical protein